MAIASITKPFTSRLSKLRLRSKPKNTASPSPETTSPGRSSSDGGEIVSAPKSSSKEDEFRQVFAFLDANNDGEISADELRAYFSSVGDTAAHEGAEKIIGELCAEDSNNLLLRFKEFERVMELRDSGEDNVVLRRAFEVYEVEKGSGCITAEGLRQVLRRLGVDVKSVEECRAMIRVYDLDGNGVLDFDEFYKMMMT
ncbi:probable calcium-binding protein cml41 [Phtheirospermum japonicum]|uniref:Probable calcium-binding protein cml41 n=1 Tax=Phtheirospermum japonicum TaxID=374723 RepID=A0A830D5F2_9LAMI|nr:probable calcium-binding protein cml41 [Phtheirospermum japonicum]